MNIRFGNLTVAQFEERVGTEFTEGDRATLETYRTDVAGFTDQSKFHIFDDPAICIVVGDEALHAIRPIMTAANARSPFNRPVSFFPRVTP